MFNKLRWKTSSKLQASELTRCTTDKREKHSEEFQAEEVPPMVEAVGEAENSRLSRKKAAAKVIRLAKARALRASAEPEEVEVQEKEYVQPSRRSLDTTARQPIQPRRSLSHDRHPTPQAQAADYGESSRRKAEIAQGKRPVRQVILSEEDHTDSEGYTPPSTQSRKQPTPQDYYELFMECDFAATRFPHRSTMRNLGIQDDVELLFQNCGLRSFMMCDREAYKDETCQFLASLNVYYYSASDDDESGVGYFTFTIHDKRYSYSTNNLEKLFGFPSGTETCTDFNEEELKALWKTIGNGDYSSSRSKSNEIRSPAIRYFHRCVASTFFARQTIGTVNEGELQMIDLALQPLLPTTADGTVLRGDGSDTPLSIYLLRQFLNYRDWAVKNRGKKNNMLTVGGIITPILSNCGVPLRSEAIEPRRLDMRYLKNATFLDRGVHEDKFIFRFQHPRIDDARVLLPNSALTTLRDIHNIWFLPHPADLYYPEGTQPDTAGAANLPDPQPMDISEGESPQQFWFTQPPSPKQSRHMKGTNRNISLLQRWNKLQDKSYKALRGSVKELADSVKGLTLRVAKLEERNAPPPPPSSSNVLPRSNSASLLRRGSNTVEQARASSFEPARASSFEPARSSSFEGKQRKRRAAKPPPSSKRGFPVPLDLDDEHASSTQHDPSFHPPTTGYTMESMEAYLDSQFS